MRLCNIMKIKSTHESEIEQAKILIAKLRERVQQKVIAAETGISQGNISHILRGDFKKLGGNALRIYEYAKMHFNGRKEFETLRERALGKVKLLLDSVPNESPKAFEIIISTVESVTKIIKEKRN